MIYRGIWLSCPREVSEAIPDEVTADFAHIMSTYRIKKFIQSMIDFIISWKTKKGNREKDAQ
jgi:hypothetical protein